MKSSQFCSVCKEWLEMEVVPTSDGEEDDGVIWFRCPQCQGFLPKLSGADLKSDPKDQSASPPKATDDGEPGAPAESPSEPKAEPPSATPEPSSQSGEDDVLPWDSPADMMAARQKAGADPELPDLEKIEQDIGRNDEVASDEAGEPDEAAEPIHEYAALLASKDQSQPAPYRPWESYEVGQCIHHQAWEDCGVVVAKENLPGGRRVIKCYFEEAGVVRLIEMAPR
jgi:hypothetical protein